MQRRILRVSKLSLVLHLQITFATKCAILYFVYKHPIKSIVQTLF